MTRYYIVYTNDFRMEVESEYHWAGSFNEAYEYALAEMKNVKFATDFDVQEAD